MKTFSRWNKALVRVSRNQKTQRSTARYQAESLESRTLLSYGTLATAKNLGTISATASSAGTVTSANPNQYFKFSISKLSDVTTSVVGSASDQLIVDYNDNQIVDDGDVVATGGAVHQRLPAGTYYIGISPYNTDVAPYTISVTTKAAPADPGQTLGTATDLGTANNSTLSHSDWVGTADGLDYYKFTIPTLSDVTTSVVGSASDQLIVDYNDNQIVDDGDVVATGGAVHQRLPAGTYYIGISPYNTGDAFYTISVTTKAAPADPGQTLGTATDLGTANNSTLSHSDWVGTADGLDYYKFTIPTLSDVTTSVVGSASDQLIVDYNDNQIVDDGDVVATGGAVHQRLPAGTYYIGISPYNTGDAFYTISVTTKAAPADPGQTLGTATDLGTANNSTLSHSDWVGTADGLDYYKFTIPTLSDVTTSVVGSASDQLIVDYNDNQIVDDGDVVATGGAVHQRLPAGTYYIGISPYNTGDAFYTISVTTKAAPADPGQTLGTATDLGAVNGVINSPDWVGTADPLDYYKFEVTSGRTVSISESGSVAAQLIKDFNGNGQIDSGDVLAIGGAISQQLSSGTYYVGVTPYNSGDAFYTLTVSSLFIPVIGVAAKAPAAQKATAGTSSLFTLGSFTEYEATPPYTAAVNWGDGTPSTIIKLNGAGTIPTTAHTFASIGGKKVSVTVTDSAKHSSTITFAVTVAAAAPSLIVTPPAAQAATAGSSKPFSLGSFIETNATGPYIATIVWGDRTANTTLHLSASGTIPATAHLFANIGSDTASVTVSDSVGHISNKATFVVTVSRAVVNTGVISGAVFNDWNADGKIDDGELGLGDYTVFIDFKGSGKFAAGDPIAVSAIDGSWSFTGLASGTFKVMVEPVSFAIETTPAALTIKLSAGGKSTGNLFGEKAPI